MEGLKSKHNGQQAFVNYDVIILQRYHKILQFHNYLVMKKKLKR